MKLENVTKAAPLIEQQARVPTIRKGLARRKDVVLRLDVAGVGNDEGSLYEELDVPASLHDSILNIIDTELRNQLKALGVEQEEQPNG